MQMVALYVEDAVHTQWAEAFEKQPGLTYEPIAMHRRGYFPELLPGRLRRSRS